jgi:hypothetical protein
MNDAKNGKDDQGASASSTENDRGSQPASTAISTTTLPPAEATETKVLRAEILPASDVKWEILRTQPTEQPKPGVRPLIRESLLRRVNAFYWLPRSRARTGLVISTPRSGPTPVAPTGRPSKADILWGGATLYEVDLGLNHAVAEFPLPSSDRLISFMATAEIEWRVVDPARVVGDNLQDVRAALVPLLRCRLRTITRPFGTADVSAADDACNKAVENWEPGTPYGLQTRFTMILTADEQSIEHAAARMKLQQQIEIENLEHSVKYLADRHERERQRARLDVYRSIIAAGNVEQFALQLARKPDDVRAVMQLAREERNEERRELTDFLTKLLSSGAIDRWDIEDQVREALTWLAESTQRTVQTGDFNRRWVPPATNGVSVSKS